MVLVYFKSIFSSNKVSLRIKSLIQDGCLRPIVSSISEPPFDSTVIEKPFTVMLMEDRFIYDNTWEDSLKKAIPRDYGMSFISLSFPEEHTFDQVVEDLKTDMSRFNDAILIARGPLSSWSAQFYLESFPLKGLVMIDPILFDQQFEENDGKTSAALKDRVSAVTRNQPLNFEKWETFLLGALEKKLRLEPNSVPMLVMSSQNMFTSASKNVAKRHSDNDGLFGEVLMREITTSNDKNLENIMRDIYRWIDTIY
jgi:hypothetical protein